MKNELKFKFENLLSWIKIIVESHKKNKVSVLMNNHVSGFISSKIASEIVGKENVINVVMPCYSDPEYLLNAGKFSNDTGVKYKNIGMKSVYDAIMEKDIENESIDIKDFLRQQILDALSFKNGSMIFSLHKDKDKYVFKITSFEEIYGEVRISTHWHSMFTNDELKELAIHLEIENE